MNNYWCAILSRSDYVSEQILRSLGKNFHIDQNSFSLINIRPKEISLDNEISINNQLEQLNLQYYNSFIIGVKFDRIDIMIHEIKQYTLPLYKYQMNIIILVIGFELSEYQEEDMKMVQALLKRFSPLKSQILLDVHSIKRNLSNYIKEMPPIQINTKDDDLPSNDNNFNQQLDQLFTNYLQENNHFQNNNPQQNRSKLQEFFEWITKHFCSIFYGDQYQ